MVRALSMSVVAISLLFILTMSNVSLAEEGHGHGTDLTSGHASAGQEDLKEFKSDKSFWSLVVFGLLFGGLSAFAWKPISQGLELREQGIATQIAEAKRASEEAMAKLKEYDAKLQSAHAQAQELLVQARKDAESAGQRIVSDAQAEATRQRDRALADIESAKQSALSELSGKSTDIAFSLARRVVGRELKTADHQQLIADSLSKMPSRN
jgi:F-type H+-transporting ATPase subunit b